MNSEWDPNKAALNYRKHGVRFADAVSALEDELALTRTEETAAGEERFVTVGSDAFGRVLVVVYTWRRDRVRIISARKATPTEVRAYTEG